MQQPTTRSSHNNTRNTHMHIPTTKWLPYFSQGTDGSGGSACVGCEAADVVGEGESRERPHAFGP